ncbi:Interferon regulatory factor 9 [Sciurus carolinensis]|uniref:Interferon regulatory factor 9 n=1 Tax=Sciurus carolinensis TaxID=30640 RepID=A0AA41NH23_SCICA|nr:Interferon regulatory factor 9 [Sciurus carolinensis]
MSSEREEDEGTMNNCALSPTYLQDPLDNEVRINGEASHSDCRSSSSSSPEPQEGADTTEDQVSMEHLLPLDSDYLLLLTFIYGGRVVGTAQVHSLDCRLVAEPSGSRSSMEQVIFLKSDPLEPVRHLLSQIERGIWVAVQMEQAFARHLLETPEMHAATFFLV